MAASIIKGITLKARLEDLNRRRKSKEQNNGPKLHQRLPAPSGSVKMIEITTSSACWVLASLQSRAPVYVHGSSPE